jgi:hypothetical protein
MFSEGGNGGGGGSDEMLGRCPKVERLVLEYDRATDELRIGGRTGSDESALAMLRRAVFTYEMKVRAAIAAQLAEQIHQQQRDAALAQSIARGTRQ